MLSNDSPVGMAASHSANWFWKAAVQAGWCLPAACRSDFEDADGELPEFLTCEKQFVHPQSIPQHIRLLQHGDCILFGYLKL